MTGRAESMTAGAVRSATVSTDHVQRLIRSLRDCGVVVPPRFLSYLNRPGDARMPAAKLADVWRWALRHTGDPVLGIRLAQVEPLGRWGELEPMLLTCRDPTQLYERARRYWDLVAEGRRFRLIDEGKGLVRLELSSSFPEEHVARQMCESALLYVTRFVRLVFGASIRPLEVRLTRRAVQQELASYFEAPVSFGSKHEALVYSAAGLTTQGVLHESGLHDRLVFRIEARLDEARSGPIAPRVGALLRDEGAADLRGVARALGLSTRVLQRRLAEEGTSWRVLRDSSRRVRAEHLVANSSMSFAEVAARLGYAEPSAFFRAFKRWTGTTAQARRNQGTTMD